jgi:hypothetical protein
MSSETSCWRTIEISCMQCALFAFKFTAPHETIGRKTTFGHREKQNESEKHEVFKVAAYIP